MSDADEKCQKLEGEAKEYLKAGNKDQAKGKVKIMKMEQENKKKVEGYAKNIAPSIPGLEAMNSDTDFLICLENPVSIIKREENAKEKLILNYEVTQDYEISKKATDEMIKQNYLNADSDDDMDAELADFEKNCMK